MKVDMKKNMSTFFVLKLISERKLKGILMKESALELWAKKKVSNRL